MTPDIHDQIARAIAQEVGFECFLQRNCEYALRKTNTGCLSPALYGRSAGRNPCGEIPLDYYEIYLTISEGHIITLNGILTFDLFIPDSIERIKKEFADLQQLERKISNGLNEYEAHPSEPGLLRKKQRT